LAKKAGVPETSLRDAENGVYKMSPEVASKIAFATGVDPKSLLAGDDPLLDFAQRPVSKSSRRLPEFVWWRQEHREVQEQIHAAFLDAVTEKKIGKVSSFSFEIWLLKAIESFGVEDLFIRNLTERLHLFDPSLVPFEFRPKGKQLAKEWDEFERQILEETNRLFRQAQADDPGYWEKAFKDQSPVTWEFREKMNDFRQKVRERVRQRIESAKG
jgi:hypothetical protein